MSTEIGMFLLQIFIAAVVSASGWGIHRLVKRIDDVVKTVHVLDLDMQDIFAKTGMIRRSRDKSTSKELN